MPHLSFLKVQFLDYLAHKESSTIITIMENIDECFSEEALRLLEDDGKYFRSATKQPQGLVLADDFSFLEPTSQPQPKRRRRDAGSVPGCSTLDLPGTIKSKSTHKKMIRVAEKKCQKCGK